MLRHFFLTAALVPLIGGDDPLNQHVAHHILRRQAADGDIRDMPGATWRDIVAGVLEDCNGRASLEEIYQRVEGHKRAQNQQWWKEKVRQTLQINPRTFEKADRGIWCLVKHA